MAATREKQIPFRQMREATKRLELQGLHAAILAVAAAHDPAAAAAQAIRHHMNEAARDLATKANTKAKR